MCWYFWFSSLLTDSTKVQGAGTGSRSQRQRQGFWLGETDGGFVRGSTSYSAAPAVAQTWRDLSTFWNWRLKRRTNGGVASWWSELFSHTEELECQRITNCCLHKYRHSPKKKSQVNSLETRSNSPNTPAAGLNLTTFHLWPLLTSTKTSDKLFLTWANKFINSRFCLLNLMFFVQVLRLLWHLYEEVAAVWYMVGTKNDACSSVVSASQTVK